MIRVTTLAQLFRERVKRSPEHIAYRYFENKNWHDLTWQNMSVHVANWQAALAKENLAAGDRVAIMLRNCPEWVMFDQAALGLGLVTVPLYINVQIIFIRHTMCIEHQSNTVYPSTAICLASTNKIN